MNNINSISILNQNIFVYLAKYTYTIYIVHALIIVSFKDLFLVTHKELINLHPLLCCLLIFVVVLSLSVAIYHFIEEPIVKYLKKKFL